MASAEIRRLRAFETLVSADVGRDLNLLAAIDTVLEEIDVGKMRFDGLNHTAEQIEYFLFKRATAIADADELVRLYDSARDVIARVYASVKARHESAESDPRLTDEDGISEGFAELLEAVRELHNHLNRISWLIGENAADHDEAAPGEFQNADDFFAAIGV